MGCLCLNRREGQSIIFGERDYVLTLLSLNGKCFTYSVKTPSGVEHYNQDDEPNLLGGDIKISAISLRNQVRFYLDCNSNMSVHRDEVYQRILDEREGMREAAGG